jgi:G3E family GTPase
MNKMLGEIFERPVDRTIEGVIKADDDASLKIEIDEYVLTNEIESKLEAFANAYATYETANGVWISGFFGSGKSHLLKMLAILLDNREIEGVRAYDLFAPKCAENKILAADLKRAVEIPSRSVLFNIDQKADVIAKTQTDALLGVFQKVFDELSGYYGKQPYIAQFERDLDSRNILVAFKVAYAEIARKPWQRGREQTILEGANIAKAYCVATGSPESEATGILDKYRKDYRSSIEDFADRVKAYVDAQGPKFRLNFFVDEVGQYIADNVKLMTNLQTIAESLNTKCRGRAWIVVTAQQDMASVIGDMTQSQENDFSKIQARFANRIPLNSADVAEVIQRRLLEKTDEGIALLSDMHHVQAPNLKTLFDFTDGSLRLENFRDRDHFIKSYPFVPYQYRMFQLVIQSLSEHNAFEGKHSSVGERSMLGVFQDVAKSLAKMRVGRLATFDQMFEGIRTALKSNVQQSILTAERNLDDVFATRVLKALFLVKYVKPFKATVRNIAILLQSEFDIDQTQHRHAVEHALSLLEQQTYIQRNGECFEGSVANFAADGVPV